MQEIIEQDCFGFLCPVLGRSGELPAPISYGLSLLPVLLILIPTVVAIRNKLSADSDS